MKNSVGRGNAIAPQQGAPVGPRTLFADDSQLPDVSDEMLQELLGQTLPYAVVILKAGQRYSRPGPNRDPEVAALIWLHGKRNMRLRVAGLMPIICPISDDGPIVGVGVLATSPEEADHIYSLDPAVQAGVLSYEVHPTRSFPGSSLN